MGFGVLQFWPFLPRFFGVLNFEARFCSFLQHHGLRLLVLIIYGLQICCSWFFSGFITHTLHAALQHYTDIVVSVLNDFGHGFRFLVHFVADFATPQCPPRKGGSGSSYNI